MRSWMVCVLACAVLLVTTGCDAPLAPAPTKSTGPSASASASPSTLPPTSVPARGVAKRIVVGADASWPQCPKGMGIPQKRTLGYPMPLPRAEFVVLGLTNGPGFHPNPCLTDQVAWAKERHLWAAAYSVISWPERRFHTRYARSGPYDGSTRLGALANNGYQQARFNVDTMTAAGLSTPAVWVDVEPVTHFEWSRDTAANAAVVRGAVRGYRDLGYTIGLYSTTYLWQEVVGGLRLGLPEWRAAGEATRREALRRCGPAYSFQGGPSVLSQWLTRDRDQDVTCPGTSRAMTTWFQRY